MSTVTFPSATTWITPRTLEVQVTTDNCVIILPQKIGEINHVYFDITQFPLTVYFIVGDSTYRDTTPISQIYTKAQDGTYVPVSPIIDVIHNVVEKSKYDTLLYINSASLTPPQQAKQLKNNCWYFTRESNEIVCVNNRISVALGQTNVFNNLVASAFYAQGYSSVYYYDSEQYRTVTGITFSGDLPSSRFRIVYVPLGESVKLQVPKTNPQENEFHIPFSQQQPIVNNLTLGREMQSLANRTGCEIKQVVRTFTSISQYRKPGAFWREKDANGNLTGNVWRLTSTNLQIYSDSLFQCTETWSKNWSLRSENVPINREFRSWNIPADTVQRNLLWNDYCLVSDKTLTVPDDAIISPSAVEQLVLALKSGTPSIVFQNECSLTWFYTIKNTPQQTKQGAVLSCASFGFGNSLVFSSKTKDNLSAGMQRVPADDNDTDYQLCRNVYYCNSDGTLESMYIQIAGEFASNDTQFCYTYPEYSDNGTTAVNAPPLNDEKLFKDGMQFKVLKDPAEQLNFTYQLHLITDNPNLVIGSAWASYNPLVKRLSQGISVKTWLLTSYLPAGAKVMTSAYGRMAPANDATVQIIVGDNPGIDFVFTQAQISSGVVGVCITDNNNNVMLAYNSNVSTTFSLYVTHFYANIYAALQQLQLQEQQQTDNQ